MNNQTLVICDFKILYEILSELENKINFNLIYVKNSNDFNYKLKKVKDNYMIISEKEIKT